MLCVSLSPQQSVLCVCVCFCVCAVCPVFSSWKDWSAAVGQLVAGIYVVKYLNVPQVVELSNPKKDKPNVCQP